MVWIKLIGTVVALAITLASLPFVLNKLGRELGIIALCFFKRGIMSYG